eukprot:2220378-Prymnesium_polylepis.1
MGISAAGKDSAKLHKDILEAKKDGMGDGRVQFVESPREGDETVLLWDVRMGRVRTADGDGFWQEHFTDGRATDA